jgi:osmotically-inducible protein OsmY
MSRLKQVYALALAVILMIGALPACAAYRKCGFAGCPGDAKITADVRALIDQYPVLEAPYLVRFQTLNHVVYLSRQVNTDLERSMAESVASAVADMTRVMNTINVTYGGR